VATPVLPEVQLAVFVTTEVVESLYFAVATNCCVPATGIEAVVGVTAIGIVTVIDVTVAGATVPAPITPLLPPPHPATKAVSSNAMNHVSGFVIRLNLFIFFSLYLIQKTPV
jgi:hypothetical protein